MFQALSMNKSLPLLSLLVTVILCFPAIGQTLSRSGSNINSTHKKHDLFTENKGQFSDQNYNPRPDVLFGCQAGGLNYHLRTNGVSYQSTRVLSWKPTEESDFSRFTPMDTAEAPKVPNELQIYRVDLTWLGINEDYAVVTEGQSEDYENYYLPTCPDGALNVRSYESVTFIDIYDGIDLRWYQRDGNIEYDFIVDAGNDYKSIHWKIDGAESLSINDRGDLVINTPNGKILENRPIAFQGNEKLHAEWLVSGNEISFHIEDVDPSRPLLIDPVVRIWGSYYGGSSYDYSYGCDANEEAVIVSGWTLSTSNISTSGGFQVNLDTSWTNYEDAYLAKFNTSGQRLWATYYGGEQSDRGYTPTFSGSNIFLPGRTRSFTVIATSSAHQNSFAGGTGDDAFLVKFNTSGFRYWGTYYGGTGVEYIHSCGSDGSNVYILGWTSSDSNIASAGSHQPAHGGAFYDGFLAKFNSTGVRQWGTFYGGEDNEEFYKCEVVGDNVYIAGWSKSDSNIATTGAHQVSHAGGETDIVLAKFSSEGERIWATYYGGSSAEGSWGCTADSTSVYLTGWTQSASNISTSGTHQPSLEGYADALLVKFDTSGVRQWGTYYGGSGLNIGRTVDIHGGDLYIGGQTDSSSGIATAGSFQTNYGGGARDAYVAKFDTSGARIWGTYYGGEGFEYGAGIACYSGGVYLSHYTSSDSNMSSNNAHQISFGGMFDAFLARFGHCDNTSAEDSIVECDSLTWIDGVTYFANNSSATHTINNSLGCDSVVTLNLTIHQSSFETLHNTACDAYTWNVANQTFTESGSYPFTLSNVLGCDSIVTLELIIESSTSSVDSIQACDSLTWINGVTYYEGNVSAVDTLINAVGCDSIVHLNLSLSNSSTSIQEIEACSPFNWIDGNSYENDTLGVVYHTTNQSGCDSLTVLNLDIMEVNTAVDVDSLMTTVTAQALASYQWLNCDSLMLPISGENQQSYVSANGGSVAVEITQNGCVDTSECIALSPSGVTGFYGEQEPEVYPNPTTGKLTVRFNRPNAHWNISLQNNIGQILIESTATDQASLELSFEQMASGVYYLMLQTSVETIRYKVIKVN